LNLKPYIESGILELYVLGVLAIGEKMGVERMISVYPELRIELQSIEEALENYAFSNAIKPNAKLKHTILASIANTKQESEMAVGNLPLINKFTDYKNWLKLMDEVGPITLENGLFLKELRHDEQVLQSFIVAAVNIPEETHALEHESFLILEGQVNCIINGKSNLMGPGDFMAIPLNEPHDVILLSNQVTAILQRVKI
jgi:mannose-6-phosphate isomerase-like protein (cupin superfamily)